MRAITQVLALGLTAGGIYGLLALGIVLVYRGSRVLNFAQGEIGTLGLYVAWFFTTKHGMPWLIGAVAAVVAATLVGLGFERAVVRPMGDATRVSVAVATVGLLLFLLSAELKFFGPAARSVGAPVDGVGVLIAGVLISPTQIIGLGVTLAIALGLGLLLTRTDFGLGVLAAAEDPVAVRLVGVSLSRVSAFTWGAGAALSAIAALLIEPSIGVFAPGFAARLFVTALAAALVGGLTSLPGAFVGGLVVGVAEAAVTRLSLNSALPGVPTLAIFGIIVAVLVFRPAGVLGKAAA